MRQSADSRVVKVFLVTALLAVLPIFQNVICTKALPEAIAEDFLYESTGVKVQGDRLSVSLVNADLNEVLKEVGRQGNIKIVYKNPPNKKVTVSFDNLPIEKGLDKLLQEQNFLLTYARTEIPEGPNPRYTISQLFLLEKSNTTVINAARPNAPLRAPSPPPPPAPEFVPPAVPESSAVPEPPDALPLPEIPPNVINDILAQDPEVQEELLETLHEAMQEYPEEVSGQLRKMLDEMQKQGLTESETFQEALEQMLKEGGPPPDLPSGPPMDEDEE